MRQLALAIAFLLAVAVFPTNTFAVQNSASSAALTPSIKLEKEALDSRVQALTNVFHKYNSPLEPYAKAYVEAADKHGVDWKLLPAISGLESSFGKFLMPDSHNGYGWGGGHIYFASWEEGIDIINKTLRENYMNKWKATDVWSIGPIYAESPTWSVRVDRFMNEINGEYLAVSAQKTLVPSL